MSRKGQELVSIVVPVYNVEVYLKECLDSLVGQTYQAVEILLIDDGSTDESGKICDDYAKRDHRVQVFHQKNAGVSAARNLGIKMASGVYLLFVDSDDQVHPQLVELYMKYAENGKVLLCDTTSDIEELHRDYDIGKKVPLEKTGSKDFMRLFGNYYINSPVNKLYLSKVLKENQICFPEGNDLGEDLLFNLEYLRYAPKDYQIIRLPLYYYREDREGSLSNSYRRDLFETQQESFTALKRFLEDMDVWDEANERSYYELYWDRLYLTVKIYREFEKFHPKEQRLKEILKDSIWKDVWKACRRAKAANWKRRIKSLMLKVYQLSR